MEKLIQLGIKALKETLKVHNQLGEEGLRKIQRNEHGETSLLCDIECEKAVIDVFKNNNIPLRIISEEHGETSLLCDIECEKAVIDVFKNNNIPLRIISEEHGEINLSENPIYLAVLDGLDGTNVYETERGKGRYGTMFGIFSNLNPDYNDYIFCGVMEHSSNKLYYAVKNEGAFLISNGNKEKINCSLVKELNKSKIYADEYFDRNRKVTLIHDTFLSKLKGHHFLHSNSSAIHYVDLARGNVDLVLQCTRKGNLEIAVAFGLINEANGVIVTIDGKSLSNKKYKDLGQKEYIPIISASTIELANELIKKIK